MESTRIDLKTVVSHAKEYGFVFPATEIYDGLSAVYDYGQLGVLLKNKIKAYWWASMVQLHENVVGIDSAIFMHPTTWKASGHVDAFSDPLIDNKDSKKRYRADVLVEDYVQKIEGKIQKEITKANKRFGEAFDEPQFRQTNPRVLANQSKIDSIQERLSQALNKEDYQALKQLIEELEISCPVSGSKNWTDVRQFNLMFDTEIGALADGSSKIYLRPETAQGIFVNFLNVQKTSRQKLPFGIAQIGKAFRNEIIARQFIFRMREFEQMEMQFFVKPGEEIGWYEYWKEQRFKWHLSLGFEASNYRFHDHIKLAHYANAACDIEFNFPFGFKELEGIHSRTDFDLTSHQTHSGKNLKAFDAESNESFVPYVVETSVGVDRLFLAVFSRALQQQKLPDGTQRVVLQLPEFLSPYQLAIFPLVKKDGLPELARTFFEELKYDFSCVFDAKDSIGKRYRRQDAIGTPFCITIDHDSLNDNKVTLRNRDTMQQERVSLDQLKQKLNSAVLIKEALKRL